jgi:hypothetical protein
VKPIKLLLDSRYGTYYLKDDAYTGGMDILGNFLAIDVGCSGVMTFKAWALIDKRDPKNCFAYSINGEATQLSDGCNNIYLTEKPVKLRMTRRQFVELLDEWQEKVCKQKPKKVIIKHKNDQFFIETLD